MLISWRECRPPHSISYPSLSLSCVIGWLRKHASRLFAHFCSRFGPFVRGSRPPIRPRTNLCVARWGEPLSLIWDYRPLAWRRGVLARAAAALRHCQFALPCTQWITKATHPTKLPSFPGPSLPTLLTPSHPQPARAGMRVGKGQRKISLPDPLSSSYTIYNSNWWPDHSYASTLNKKGIFYLVSRW